MMRWSLLVHERLAVIACFAYSQAPLLQMRKDHFKGQFKFLDKFSHELPRVTATQALIELALYFRALDDDEGLTNYWKQDQTPSVGTLMLKHGKEEPLSPREMANKIMHAERIEWYFVPEPTITCFGANQERWVSATIPVWKLASLGAQLGS
jgi:hypothetical protein